MGAHLMTLVLMRWTHVSDRAFRVLSRMATTALDEPTNGFAADLYFAGRDLLAMSLREPFPDGDDEASSKAREYQHKRVQKAVRELVEAGAIERYGSARDGKNQAYRLTLLAASKVEAPKPSRRGGLRQPRSQGGCDSTPDTTNNPADSSAEGGCDSPLQGGCDGGLRGAATDPRGGLSQPPLGVWRRKEELLEEEKTDLRTDLTVARASPLQDRKIVPELIDPAPPVDPPNDEPAEPEPPPSRDPADALTAAVEAEWRIAGRTLPVCNHGLANVLRGDGLHACVPCRRLLRASGPPSSVPASLRLVGSAAARVPRGPADTDPDLPPIRTAEGA